MEPLLQVWKCTRRACRQIFFFCFMFGRGGKNKLERVLQEGDLGHIELENDLCPESAVRLGHLLGARRGSGITITFQLDPRRFQSPRLSRVL